MAQDGTPWPHPHTPMDVRFREVDPFNCWIWLRLAEPLTEAEKPYLTEVFDSWYYLGKLGGFNAENLQVHEEGADISWMHYSREQADTNLASVMHNMGDLETRAAWCRIWVDLGTSDALALDVLINALGTLDQDVVRVEEVVIGGINSDWPVEEPPESFIADGQPWPRS